jgi:hypothetical protein
MMSVFLFGFVCGALFAAAICGIAHGVAEIKKSRDAWRSVSRGSRY